MSNGKVPASMERRFPWSKRTEAERKTAKPKPTPTPTPKPKSTTAKPTPKPRRSATPTLVPTPTPTPTLAPIPLPDPDDDHAGVPNHRFRSQVDFSSEQLDLDNPGTEFLQTPQTAVVLDFFSRDLAFDDGKKIEIWSFQTEASGRSLPGPTLRPKEGEIFHATFTPGKGAHTIHWHGMEPDPRNDGVGHTSFEIGNTYTYQWQAEPGRPGDPNYGAAGTYFYHCHVNTVLHAQMGMFGALVVDPVVHPSCPVSPGARRAFVDGPEYDIESETILVPYSVDPRWHEMNHAAGLSGEDVGLNRFEPKHFYLLGGQLSNRGDTDDRAWSLSSISANVVSGARKPTLLRIVNANYLPNRMYFTDAAGHPARIAEIIAHDGRPFRDTSIPGVPAPTCSAAGYPLLTSVLAFGAAERYDVMLMPRASGRYELRVEWEDWITGATLAVRTVPIIVT
ncbi:multicopper oxidase domain-containing protein [Arthrobacter sp. H20]|uniref:multicopper oxidase domain-containing protein n=1 Tax=Arthrobacter sp. H20 TaxID=1267981 RepID=UPI0020A699FE|nr:multicopper oxidase domain-containing protein [Arthrobacter sp. H20]